MLYTDYDTYYFHIFNLDFHCTVSTLHQQQKLDAISSLSYNSTSQCLPCYIIQIFYPLRSVKPDPAPFQLISFLKIHFLHHVQEMNQQEQNKIKIPNRAVLRTPQKLLCTYLLFRLRDLPGRIYYVWQGYYIKDKRAQVCACSRSVQCLPADCTWPAVLPPFLARLQFPSSLTSPLPGRTCLLSLPASHSSQLLLVSLAPALPQPPGQGGINSRPKMWRGKEFGGHLPLRSVSAEAKSQWHGCPPRSYSTLMNRENCSNKFLASSSHFMQLQHYTASLVTTSASQSIHTPGS